MLKEPAPQTQKSCWIDIETDGLVRETGTIFEVGAVAADKDHKPFARTTFLIDYRHNFATWEDLVARLEEENPFVFEMHTESGLLEDLKDYSKLLSIEEARSRLEGFIIQHGLEGTRLGGYSVHFDRAWIEHHIPGAIDLLSHRHLDTTSETQFMIDSHRYVKMVQHKLFLGTAHRALDDSLSALEKYRQMTRINRPLWRKLLDPRK